MNRIRFSALLLVGILLLASPLVASKQKDKKEKKEKDHAKAGSQVVDEGSFGVFVSGRRVATETFTVKQLPDGSVTTSEIKMEGSNEHQTSTLELTPAGDLVRYEWKESGGMEKGETTVMPSQQFLTQQIKLGDKTSEQPYLMPSSTSILDDYFFSQRELLLWKYIGSSCRPVAGQKGCQLEKGQFGFVVPRQRLSGMATINYIGREMVSLHGVPKELSKFSMTSEFGDWVLWLDDSQKLVRVILPGESTEVIRD